MNVKPISWFETPLIPVFVKRVFFTKHLGSQLLCSFTLPFLGYILEGPLREGTTNTQCSDDGVKTLHHCGHCSHMWTKKASSCLIFMIFVSQSLSPKKLHETLGISLCMYKSTSMQDQHPLLAANVVPTSFKAGQAGLFPGNILFFCLKVDYSTAKSTRFFLFLKGGNNHCFFLNI